MTSHTRSALVTGATGFVGRHLTAELVARGWRVTALVRSVWAAAPLAEVGASVEVLGDPEDLARVFEQRGVGVAFHLAAHQSRGHSTADIDAFVDANLRLGLHLFATAARCGARVVNTLTYFQFRDSMPAPHSLYSATKQAQAVFADYWRAGLGADIRDVVLFDNYGAGDQRAKLVPALIRAAFDGTTLTIGPRAQLMDLLHVRDVVAGLIAVAEGPASETLTVRARGFVSVGEIVDAVAEAVGHEAPVAVDPGREASDLPVVSGSWPTPPHWQPRVSLAEGIAECVAAAR